MLQVVGIFLNTEGSANLSEFFSAPCRTVPQQTVYRSEK
jgi:hypothetical protein